ncbi:NUDIX hydrolase [Cellulomonas carbonis]|uniref:NUDIX hydrolase n=1 Tax=Cellulomonas carbonis T26 TaxID=947969 RepID=A0A0A0BKH0_9CELL|nr:NUDIX domain-containing protein [Cellulomonas carbonis]KGM08486.1 NUDIX hydrolase [Cellulomonas carbonis T26]GGB99422.1 NUDIX hydrolase [Cellulomonas carbonis]
MPDHLADLTATLATWSPAARHQVALRDQYLAFLAANGPSALRRDGGPEHVTASCFVLTPDLSHVLLSLHRKGGFWVQLGGHLEPDDASVSDAAHREAAEEGGVDALDVPWRAPVDLDRHALSDRFGRCRVHWDVGYVAFAAHGAQPTTSDESDDVAWFPVDELPPVVPPGFASRLATVLDVVRTRRQ